MNKFNQNGSFGEHSHLDKKHGIYASTGSLGHGLPIGVGYAIANPYKMVIVIVGDGELDEGSNYEALRVVRRLKLKNLLVVCDGNGYKGYHKADEVSEMGIRQFYSEKGEGLGEIYHNKVNSHYVRLNEDLVDNFKKYWNDKTGSAGASESN